jgi:hypothetical protein
MKEEIKGQKKIRAFASFQDEKHQKMLFEELLEVVPKKHAHRLFLYLGMMDSTLAEGYQEENK